MEQSTTGQAVDQSVAVSNSSTTETTTNPAEASVQDGAQNQAPQVTDTSAGQNNQADAEEAALAQFAKGQGINDLSELSDRERSLLKMARDNKSALDRTKGSQPKLDESSTALSKLGDDATDVQKLTAKVANMEFAQTKSKFFEGKDTNLEPVMAQIVADKRQQFGDDYARSLLNDLPTLYALAQSQGTTDTSAIEQAAREQERNSMNQSLAASGADAHAVNSAPVSQVKVTDEWIENEYDSNNPEHRKLLDAALKR